MLSFLSCFPATLWCGKKKEQSEMTARRMDLLKVEKEGRWWSTFGGDGQESSAVHDHVKHLAAEAAVGGTD